MSREAGKETVKPAGDPPQMQLKWDDTNMKTSYANVCNVMSTREEVVLMFGVNQAWHAGQKEVTIQLTERIILRTDAANRLYVLLGNMIKQDEDRLGALSLEQPRAADAGMK